jgi:ParB family chromosome partitioning protein
MTRKALGRGLGALIPGAPGPTDAPEASAGLATVSADGSSATEIGGERVRAIPLDRIVPNPKQPRIEFAEEALAELAESIRAQGVLQPISCAPRASRTS